LGKFDPFKCTLLRTFTFYGWGGSNHNLCRFKAGRLTHLVFIRGNRAAN